MGNAQPATGWGYVDLSMRHRAVRQGRERRSFFHVLAVLLCSCAAHAWSPCLVFQQWIITGHPECVPTGGANGPRVQCGSRCSTGPGARRGLVTDCHRETESKKQLQVPLQGLHPPPLCGGLESACSSRAQSIVARQRECRSGSRAGPWLGIHSLCWRRKPLKMQKPQ